jgi:tripartite-type tricarboxylate transporter receptor subunit TctC
MTRLNPVAFLIAALVFGAYQPACAQESYPTHPIRLIVGFAAGSSGDVAARIVSHKLGDLLGQTVIVENRPGASSMIATDYVARSAKDGYTLLFGTIAMTINPILMPNKAPNIEKDMAPIVLVGSIPNILVPGRSRMSCSMVQPASAADRTSRPNCSSKWRE